MSELMHMGIALMGYGLLGVFSILGIFIGLISLIVRLFPAERQGDREQ